jgi:hypothetical protein
MERMDLFQGKKSWFASVLLRNSLYCPCDKIPEKNNLKEERFILAHGFRGFILWSLAPSFWACGEAEHMMTGACGGGGFSPHGGQETERECRKELG